MDPTVSAVSVMSDPRDLSVYIGINKEDPNKGSASEPFKAVLNVSKITVHDFDFCDAYNDLALIELSQNVTESASVPICMPSEDLQLHRVLYASGAGMDPASPKTLADPYQLARGQQVVAQKFYAVEDLWHMILTQTFSKLPMPGDAGGPLFQVDESEIHTLVGIACCGDDEWKSDIGENYRAAYVDVRAYLDWICKYSAIKLKPFNSSFFISCMD
ncbi:hypothetical protein Y032_0146g2525 [Ancylostoma ceylanicum]|uniref:Peptidase S1 domain-containing protein n=1 Tax=Ancylostoma ceylanicum TaxID=53326 RepID=A0A016T262_9BILA|nr:hypothetical protein Y032_0146g2525 [Ancylostoma ceylanicum]